jgi:predicted RNase H-like HicB family nuclease
MRLPITLDLDSETGWYVATCPLLPGCVSQGETREHAIEIIQAAIQGWLEVFHERFENGEFGTPDKDIEVAV